MRKPLSKALIEEVKAAELEKAERMDETGDGEKDDRKDKDTKKDGYGKDRDWKRNGRLLRLSCFGTITQEILSQTSGGWIGLIPRSPCLSTETVLTLATMVGSTTMSSFPRVFAR